MTLNYHLKFRPKSTQQPGFFTHRDIWRRVNGPVYQVAKCEDLHSVDLVPVSGGEVIHLSITATSGYELVRPAVRPSW
jgi:hypothetical protein